MKKKLILIALTVVLTLGVALVITGCGGSDSDGGSSDGTTLTLWTHNNEDTWNESYQNIVDAYMEENPALMSEEGGADIYELWGGWGLDFAPAGVLAALPEDMQAEVKEECYPNTYGALEADGVIYGVPQEFNIECGGLIVNNNVMKEAGVEVPTTWDELKAAAEKGTVKDGKKIKVKGFDFVNWDGVMYLWTSMILSQGDNYLNEYVPVDFHDPLTGRQLPE